MGQTTAPSATAVLQATVDAPPLLPEWPTVTPLPLCWHVCHGLSDGVTQTLSLRALSPGTLCLSQATNPSRAHLLPHLGKGVLKSSTGPARFPAHFLLPPSYKNSPIST